MTSPADGTATRDRIAEVRVHDPAQILLAAERRTRPASPVGDHGRALVVAVDHLHDPVTADRGALLERVCVALERPGVTGVAAAADVLEDLLLLGALEGLSVFGVMSGHTSGGCCHAVEDVRYDAGGIAVMGFEGGAVTMPDDPATTGVAVNTLAAHRLIALVRPASVVGDDPSSGTVARAARAISGLGRTSAYTWLRLPARGDVAAALRASTLPVLLDDDGAGPEGTSRGLRHASVAGLVVGRSVLDPPDGDVAAAVDQVVRLL